MSFRLDTPLKRCGSLVLVVGVTWFGIGLMVSDTAFYNRDVVNRVLSSLDTRYDSWDQLWYLRWALCLILLGLSTSFLYDATIGRMVGWVKKGG